MTIVQPTRASAAWAWLLLLGAAFLGFAIGRHVYQRDAAPAVYPERAPCECRCTVEFPDPPPPARPEP